MYKLLLASAHLNTQLLVKTKLNRTDIEFDYFKNIKNSDQAVLEINSTNPNIIIVDIINDDTWLDFVRNFENQSKIKFIILCSSLKYNHLQKFFPGNNIFCLTFPFTQFALINTLNKVCQQIKYEKQLSSALYKAERLEQTIAQTETLEDIQSFINGTDISETINISNFFPEHICYYQIFLIRFYNSSDFENNISDKLSRFSIKNIIDELNCDNLIVFDVFTNINQLLILAGSTEENEAVAKKYLLTTAKDLHNTIIKYLPYELFIGLSKLCRHITPASFSQAKQALDLRFQSKKTEGEVFFIDDYKALPEKIVLTEDFLLFQTILQEGAINKIKNIVMRIIQPNDVTVINIRLVYLELILIVSKTLQKKDILFSNYIGTEYFNGSIIDKCQSIDQVVDSIYELVIFALKNNQENINDITFILRKIKRYIEDNYTDGDLSTSILSTKFNISLGYLSTMYKKKYGTPISKYILDLRLVLAQELLSATTLTVNRVSIQCGFKSTSYFMRVFKKKFGITPSQLRTESNIEQDNLWASY